MNMVRFFECYNFNKNWYLIEMMLDVPAEEIDWLEIRVPEDGVCEDDWQCAYMEQYLNEDGSEKICETYDIPEGNVNPCRVAFFIFKSDEDKLSTPYGEFILSGFLPVPERLKGIVEFVEPDEMD